ncbi:MAG: SIS domain-containing protein [Bryobacteraceae bacterium]|nr:SIS domain-containing protein [Bryobacteraceae bacterium]
MTYPEQYKQDLLKTMDLVDLNQVDQAIRMFAAARDEGRMIFVCGNGGSAASVSHFTCDMVKGASYQRAVEKRFKILALTDMMPTMTAYGNDVGYDAVFLEPLKNFARPGDLFMTVSCSGTSPNVVAALEYAKQIGCKTIALSGKDGGKIGPLADLSINVAASHYGRIEDAHMIVCHMICYYFMDVDRA